MIAMLLAVLAIAPSQQAPRDVRVTVNHASDLARQCSLRLSRFRRLSRRVFQLFDGRPIEKRDKTHEGHVAFIIPAARSAVSVHIANRDSDHSNTLLAPLGVKPLEICSAEREFTWLAWAFCNQTKGPCTGGFASCPTP